MLEWGDAQINQGPPGKFYNPPGLYISLIKDNVTIPPTFLSSRKRKLLQAAAEAKSRQEQEQAQLMLAYYQRQDEELESYITQNYTTEQYEDLIIQKTEQLLSNPKYKFVAKMTREAQRHYAEPLLRSELKSRVPFTTFEAFCEEWRATPHGLDKANEEGTQATASPSSGADPITPFTV